MNAFEKIENIDDFSKLIGISKKSLTYVVYKIGINNAYNNFDIPKKNGGTRNISAPNKRLRKIQKKLADKLWESQEEFFKRNNIAHAFIKNRGIISNARIHRNKKIVLNVDIEDFFHSFNFGRVYGFFLKDKDFELPNDVAKMIANLTCYKGCLPQGAPTSPIITNLICRIMDVRILKLAKKFKLDYTRYADDLTFSTNNKDFCNNKNKFLKKLRNEIRRSGFRINKKKTRIQYENMRQSVTGVVVNKKLNVSTNYYKETRAMANHLYRNGIFYIDGKEGSIGRLEGRFAFINQLDKYNNNIGVNYREIMSNNLEHQKNILSLENNQGKKTMIYKSNKREREYQKFIFYKYFYGNSKPTIVTEGKTDILYLKAALKNLYKEYPNLIEKNGSDFIFKVFFLKREKTDNPQKMTRFKYFLDLESTGADSMGKLYDFFSNNKKNQKMYPNFLSYFKEICPNRIPLNPTIFIFDNETKDNSKPLHKFINKISTDKEKREHLFQKLREKFYVNLVEDSLYLLATPLSKKMDESDIEKLLVDDFKERGQSKIDFSKQVFREYTEWNFDKFRPLLNNLNDIVVQHRKKLEKNIL